MNGKMHKNQQNADCNLNNYTKVKFLVKNM